MSKKILITPQFMADITNPPLPNFSAVFPTRKIAESFVAKITGEHERATGIVEEIYIDNDKNMYVKVDKLEGETDNMDEVYEEGYN